MADGIAIEAHTKGDTTPDASKAFWVKCGADGCGHIWAAAYFPMDAMKFARIAKAHSTCPKCGSRKTFVAKQDDGVLMEPTNARRHPALMARGRVAPLPLSLCPGWLAGGHPVHDHTSGRGPVGRDRAGTAADAAAQSVDAAGEGDAAAGVKQGMRRQNMAKQWWYSQNEERWQGPEETREAAIEAGHNEYPGEFFMVVEAEPGTISVRFDAARFLEDIDNDQYDKMDSEGEAYFSERVTKEQAADLEATVNATIAAWIARHQIDTTVWAFAWMGKPESIDAAQAGEAGTAETRSGSVHEHAVGRKPDAPQGDGDIA